jgi:ketosteroid isomerase-like protein
MSEAKEALVRRHIEAWNAGDLARLAEWVTPDVEFLPANIAAVQGTPIRGPEEMKRYRSSMAEVWESFVIQPEDFRVVGEQILMRGRHVARGRGSGLELDQTVAGVFWFRDGRISRVRSFLDLEQAEKAAAEEMEA